MSTLSYCRHSRSERGIKRERQKTPPLGSSIMKSSSNRGLKMYLTYLVHTINILLITHTEIKLLPNILDIFLTSNPSAYSVQMFFLLNSSDHGLFSVSFPTAPMQSREPPKQRCFWYYASTK